MFRKMWFLFLLIGVIALTGCSNPRAEEPGKWYLPWTWGDKTLQQSLKEGCQGGALTTNIAGSTYPCPGYTPEQPAAAPTPTPTAVVPTPATPMPVVVQWVPYESEGGVPYNGTTWAVDVAPDELEVFTAGPVCIAGVCLPGGTERGSVIVLLPGSGVVHYVLTGVIAGSNWHGSYRPIDNPEVESTWRSLAEDRIKAMQIAPNCTSGKGCATIDVLIVGPDNKVVAQWVVNK